MSKRGVDDLTQAVSAVVNRTVAEYDMTLAEVVGTLHIVATDLTLKTLEEEDDEDV